MARDGKSVAKGGSAVDNRTAGIMKRFIKQILGQGDEARSAESLEADLHSLAQYSTANEDVLNKHYILACDVLKRGVPGDLVECGVLDGGSAAVMAMAFRETDRRAWLYDSFEGLPEPTEIDGPEPQTLTGRCVGSITKVKEAMRIAGFPEDRCIIRKGWFKDTFTQPLPETVSLLHLDCDWFDSITLSLETFYDRLGDGGIILLDDFGHWEGCREAFYSFAESRSIRPLLERFGHTQAFWIKGRTHNRDFVGQWEIP